MSLKNVTMSKSISIHYACPVGPTAVNADQANISTWVDLREAIHDLIHRAGLNKN